MRTTKQEQVRKANVMCANCHRIISFEEGQTG
jgi:hypothetical protein